MQNERIFRIRRVWNKTGNPVPNIHEVINGKEVFIEDSGIFREIVISYEITSVIEYPNRNPSNKTAEDLLKSYDKLPDGDAYEEWKFVLRNSDK